MTDRHSALHDNWPEARTLLSTSMGRNNSSVANNETTVGSWDTETDSAAELDFLLDRVNLWRVYKEVRGSLVHPRPIQIDKNVRIDRILVPNSKLLNLGWTHGIIGVEIKRSAVKIGPPIAQAMDYGRSIWTLPGGVSVWLDWVLIWPMGKLHSTVESICCQHRVGSAYSTDWDLLYLRSGTFNIINISRDGDIRIGTSPSGKKVGSR